MAHADRLRLGGAVDDLQDGQQGRDEDAPAAVDEIPAGPLGAELLLVGAQALEVVGPVAEVVDVADDLLLAVGVLLVPGVGEGGHPEVVELVAFLPRPLDERDEDPVHRPAGRVGADAHEVDRRHVRAGWHDRGEALDPLVVAHHRDGGPAEVFGVEAPEGEAHLLPVADPRVGHVADLGEELLREGRRDHLEVGALLAHPVAHAPEDLPLVPHVGVVGQAQHRVLADLDEGEPLVGARRQVFGRDLVDGDVHPVRGGHRHELVDGLFERRLLAYRIAQDDQVVPVRAVQQRHLAVRGVEDVLVPQEEEVGVFVPAVFGQEGFEARHVRRPRRPEVHRPPPREEEAEGDEYHDGAVEGEVPRRLAAVGEGVGDLLVVVQAPQEDPHGNADDGYEGRRERPPRQPERLPAEGVAGQEEEPGDEEEEDGLLEVEPLQERGRSADDEQPEGDPVDAGDPRPDAAGEDDEHDPDEQGGDAGGQARPARGELPQYLDPLVDGRRDRREDQGHAGDERADPQDRDGEVFALAPVAQPELGGEQLADGVERGDEPRNDVVAHAVDDDRQEEAGGLVVHGAEQRDARQVEGAQAAGDERDEADEGRSRVDEERHPQVGLRDEEPDAEPEVDAGHEPVEERGRRHLELLPVVLQGEGRAGQVDLAPFDLAAEEVQGDVEAHGQGDDPQALVVPQGEGEGGQQHDEQADEVGRPHREGDLQRSALVRPGLRIVPGPDRPARQTPQAREVVEGLGDPPDLQGRRRGEGDPEVSRGEDVVHARRRESQNPQERYAEQLARLDGGQELAHLGAGDVLELVAGDEEHPDRHEDVEDPRCGAFVLFDEVGDSLHVPLVF